MNEQSSVVETDGLTKKFGDRTAVDHVDLRIPAGSAFGYLGPNGAGKTTLIRMLLGLTKATSGSMRLLGHPIPAERDQALARVGAIVEEPRFHPYLTGRENLRIVAAAREPEAHARIDDALARVGLTKRADERVKAYSLGMRQRLGVARALLADPGAAHPRRADERPRPGGHGGVPLHDPRLRRGGTHRRPVVAPAGRGREDVRRDRDRRPGKVVVQGTIDELTGEATTVLVATSDDARAQSLLDGYQIERVPEGLRIVIDDDATAAAVNRKLVEAGIDVHRLEPERVSLERRFLEITSRLESVA